MKAIISFLTPVSVLLAIAYGAIQLLPRLSDNVLDASLLLAATLVAILVIAPSLFAKRHRSQTSSY